MGEIIAGAFHEHAIHHRGCCNSDPARHFVADQEAKAYIFVWSGGRDCFISQWITGFSIWPWERGRLWERIPPYSCSG